MKLHDWAIIFFAIFLVNFIVVFISVKTTQAENVNDTRYSDYLTTATEDAMKVALSTEADLIFSSKENRGKTSDTFYETLSHCLGEEIRGEDYVQDMIPFIIYADKNGYYVQYRDFTSDYMLATRTSPLNTYSTSISNGRFLIRYEMGDTVEVIDRVTGSNSYGDRKDVYNAIGSADLYFLTQDDFYTERNMAIVDNIQNSINYYCNNYNYSNPYGYTYEVVLPKTTGTSEGRLIDNPCIISFIQGEWFGLTGTEANIYAFGGAEQIDKPVYMITENMTGKYYHSERCSLFNDNVPTYSMKKCAEEGAYPCPMCVR